MDPEEQELLGDYKYRNYASAIDKALRNFESSSEWADLISSLGKLNKALQSNLKYSLLPRRLIISKRLSQCLHPALPSGVHLKALETYEIIFKIVGTKWLAKDLFLYSSGLFPLLANAAMSVRPVLLGLYEKYFLPLQKCLLPSLQAFLIGLLPGLEEGSDIYDRTDALLVKLSLVIGKEVFYSALWGSVLVSPSIRLPASLFVVSHINRELSGKQQKYMLGTDAKLMIKAFCESMLDSNVLVQRNSLEVVLFFFPFYSSLDPNESAVPLSRSDIVHLLSAAAQTLLRRDMSLNRRLYAWLLGSDIKGVTLVPDSSISMSSEDHALYFFGKYSKDLLVEGLIEILQQKLEESDLEEQYHAYLKPFRILISLLDKPEIGPPVIADLFLEVIRAFYSYCKDILGSDLKLSYTQTGNSLISAIKENKNASEIVKTVNLLITSLSTDFLWDYMTRCFEDCFRSTSMQTQLPTKNATTLATVSELCTLLVFLLDVIPLELYSEVQSLYLPQMLSCLVQSLLENMDTLSLPELTHALRTCFKVLSKVQMPPAYLGTETGSSDTSPVKEENQELRSEVKVLQNEEEASFPPLKTEDSGIALSASSPELSQHLRIPRIIPEKDDVWKKGGSMQKTLYCIQGLVAKFASKYVFGVHLQDSGNGSVQTACVRQGENKETTNKKKHSWDSKQITVPQFKQMLSDLFTVRGSPFKQKGLGPQSPVDDLGNQREKEEEEWDFDQVMLDLGDLKEDCREAFAAMCYLLLDCTTFPVYLSDEETEQLYSSLFQVPGGCEPTFPLWLKSLMTICCCENDRYIQNVSISVLLEIINHSQSLALVLEDRLKRYKIPGQNPFFGKLQMVTVPPIAPAVLKLVSEKTDFYQRVAQVLWDQLNKETREHHNTCVELFYHLHCLAPSANICEDIICLALLDHDKGTRLEALFRFSIMWHLTREIQGSRVTSHNRSFDRSLFVVLDSLNYSDGAIGAAAQGWLIRALSLNDVARILEPVLLLLLHPKTQRTSIQCVKQKSSSEDMHLWYKKKKGSFQETLGARELQESSSEESLPMSQFTAVDREAIWAEVEKVPEKCLLKNKQSINDPCQCAEAPGMMGEEEDSEHTESADTSTGPIDSDNTSSFSPSLDQQDMSNEENYSASTDGKENKKHVGSSNVYSPSTMLNLVRVDSEKTQASESFSSDEEVDLELQAFTTSRLLKQQKEKQEIVEALFKHVLLYLQPYDSKRVLYAFSVLEAVLKTNPKEFIEAVGTTSMDTSSTAHLNLIYNLLTRHQEALVGQSFYGKLQTQSPTVCPHSLLIELLTYLCLSFLRSYYPCYLKVTHKDVLGNRDVQVKSVEVLIRMMTQLATMAKATESKNIEFIHNLLGRCKVQEFVLLSLSASMYVSQKCYEHMTADKMNGFSEDCVLEETLINFGRDQIWSEHPLQIELLKLLQVLIVLEHHLGQTQEELENQTGLSKEWQRALNFQEAIGAMQYVHPHPITSQGLFVSAVVRGLQPEYGYGMHPAWVSLVAYSLPYFGKSLGWTVAPFIVQICKNLDELVKQYEHETLKMSAKVSVSIHSKRENITPDYPLTLLEGLTTIGHFCLLDHPNQTKKSSLTADPTSLRNARNAILEELPRIINTMSLLWSVIKKEESQKRPTDFLGTKGSSSVYFKATKTLKNKILDFLNPLTGHLGMQFMAAVAAVWNSKRSHKRQKKTKISPVASASQLVLLDLVCALSTLKIDTILQLVKEVVKKPSQIKGEEKSSLVDIPVLHFCYAFIQRLPAIALQENFQSLLGVLKESVQLNLVPPGHFLLLSTLNDFVTRMPNQENKKDQKDLQEVTQKILEAVGNVAGSSLEQTSWLSRNLEVKAQPQISLDESNAEDDLCDTSAIPSSMVSASAPSMYSVQALSLLAEVLASLLDMVYRSDEKEKAVPLISRLLYYVFPYLRNHSTYNLPSFRASSQLLSSLSGYAYTKRAWKKDVLELYMDPAFFQMDTSCIHWRAIVDHLLTHEKTMFKDLMNMQSSSLKLFPSYEQKAMLIKRQAFAIFSGEIDQYHLYLPLIQERLTDTLRVRQTSLVAAQMFLFFRVLLLRISPQHLTSLWPIMVTELIQTFIQLEDDLAEEEEPAKNSSKINKQKSSDDNDPLFGDIQQNELNLYLSACKFLDTALSFPPDKMQLFQMYRWAFVPEVDMQAYNVTSDLMENHQECKPHIVRIMDLLKLRCQEQNTHERETKTYRFPLLDLRSISSITQLISFFSILSCAFKTESNKTLNTHSSESPAVDYPIGSSTRTLKLLEECVERDFIENMES
ncbi:protein dopey-2 [Varanus komodoensis]|uniref:DOP1 leucine zipper like protein B n=1 Tax=Varanus komodoensis TaxID=61221 RepID=A0A8D2Q710_VARKO|nr:protein dopey-2 [Varanus komodoensis]XP_044298361.1 protein dopey-2 [Varanus komodoensis]XP_044298362.1 protein dopey-2 [Varanus komodoensis]XP_044298364.1 protein dopey-2 [Varanus komodoensis]XP_044298365.1 protein dopey-2 [Varanus komodoensis]